MTAPAVLVTLLLAPAASRAEAAPAACETFTRNSEPLPQVVREWFARSSDELVLMCPQLAPPGGEAPAPVYVGGGPVLHHGAVCSYLSHGLRLVGSGAGAHLQRYEHTEALAMALADAECPRPEARPGARYVDTYDVSPASFVGIMRLWSAITAAKAVPESGAGPGSAHAGPPAAAAKPGGAGNSAAADARARLAATLAPDRLSGATVTRIVRIPGSVLRRRYALFVRVPDSAAESAAHYVIYVEKRLRGPYEISSFAETN